MANIYQQVVQQAQLLSYLDDFKILGVVFLALLPLLLLVKPGKGGCCCRPGSLSCRKCESCRRRADAKGRAARRQKAATGGVSCL